MRITRTARTVDVRTVAIDGFDMFILSRVDEPLSLLQLVEILPCEPTETMERVHRLAQLGLVRLSPESVRPEAPARGRPVERGQPHAAPSDVTCELDDALTLRPPPRAREGEARRPPHGFAAEPMPQSGVRRGLRAFEPPARRKLGG